MKNINTYYLILFLLFLIIFIITIQSYLKKNNVNSKESFDKQTYKTGHWPHRSTHHKGHTHPPPYIPNCCQDCNYNSSQSNCNTVQKTNFLDYVLCKDDTKKYERCKDDWNKFFKNDTIIYVKNEIMNNITKITYTIDLTLSTQFKHTKTKVENIKNTLNTKNNKNFSYNNTTNKAKIADSISFLNNLIQILTDLQSLWDKYLIVVVKQN